MNLTQLCFSFRELQLRQYFPPVRAVCCAAATAAAATQLLLHRSLELQQFRVRFAAQQCLYVARHSIMHRCAASAGASAAAALAAQRRRLVVLGKTQLLCDKRVQAKPVIQVGRILPRLPLRRHELRDIAQQLAQLVDRQAFADLGGLAQLHLCGTVQRDAATRVARLSLGVT